jgi:anti-sigma factor RsiW
MRDPDVDCEELLGILDGYVDEELDAGRSLEVERHLSACSTCSAVVSGRRHLHQALSDPALYHRATDDLRERVRRSLGPIGRRGRTAADTPWRLMAVAATVALAALLGWTALRLGTTRSSEEKLVQEIISGHVRSLLATHLLDVAGPDTHKVKPWFNGRVDFAPPVRDPAQQGYPLLGGRLDYLNDREVAALVYKRHDHIINLFIWPTADGAAQPPRTLDRQGYHLVGWSAGGLTYWAVSDLNEKELQEFAELIQR